MRNNSVQNKSQLPESGNNRRKINLDRIGFTTSILCAIHCAALPFMISLLPLLGLELLARPSVEISVTTLSIIIAVISFVPAYRKHHCNKTPIILMIGGLGFIFCTHFFGLANFESALVPAGALSIALAHYLNWKLSRKHSCASHAGNS